MYASAPFLLLSFSNTILSKRIRKSSACPAEVATGQDTVYDRRRAVSQFRHKHSYHGLPEKAPCYRTVTGNTALFWLPYHSHFTSDLICVILRSERCSAVRRQ